MSRNRERLCRVTTQLLVKASGRCAYCRNDLTYPSLRVAEITRDHVIPLSWGGSNALSNQVICCTRCHKLKCYLENRAVIQCENPTNLHTLCETLWDILYVRIKLVPAIRGPAEKRKKRAVKFRIPNLQTCAYLVQNIWNSLGEHGAQYQEKLTLRCESKLWPARISHTSMRNYQ